MSFRDAPKNAFTNENKCVSKTHIRQTREVVTTTPNTPPPFKGNSPVAVCITYSKLLKLTAASNACGV